jgi:hypothetical protein
VASENREALQGSDMAYEIISDGGGFAVGRRSATGIFYVTARCGLRDDAESVVSALNRVADPSYVPALEEQLAYALDALEGHPWTGWTTDDARAVLREHHNAITREAA